MAAEFGLSERCLFLDFWKILENLDVTVGVHPFSLCIFRLSVAEWWDFPFLFLYVLLKVLSYIHCELQKTL